MKDLPSTDLSDLFADYPSPMENAAATGPRNGAKFSSAALEIACNEYTESSLENQSLDATNRALIGAGASLHWLVNGQKRPLAANWSTLPNQTESELRRSYSQGQNIGIRLGQPSHLDGLYLHLIDLDIRDPAKANDAWSALLDLWPDARSFPSVISGSGGESRHIYFLSPDPMPKRKIVKSDSFNTVFDQRLNREVKKYDWEIDLMGTGSQAVLPPSIHPDTGKPYRWERPMELALPFLMHIDRESLGRFGVRQHQGSGQPVEPLDEVNPQHLEQALTFYSVEDRDHWVMVGAALHHQFKGKREGFDRWCEWSKQSAKFEAKDAARVWKSFKSDKPNAKGLRSLFREAGIDGYEWGALVSDDDFDDLPALPAESKPAKVKLIRAKNGDMKPTLHNAILVLRKVDRDQGYSIRKNDMTGQDEWRGGPINDADLGLTRVAIEQAGMHNVGADLTAGAVRAVAELNRYHPVRDWLESLHHDGKPRLDTWLTRYLGVDASPYSRAVARAFLVAMVARIMQPGCKHDHVLVLGGAQGIGKSTACGILGGEYAGDNMPSIRDGAREAGLYLRGHWLVELAELAPSRKAEAEDLKAFLTRATDEIRAPYARRADVVPRQCVFVGTTNETAFLRDASGGRRFWPVTCGAKIEAEALAEDREQLFAEAVAAFRAGEQWHLPPDLERQAAIEQEAAREEHPWEQPIRRILDGLTEGDGFDRQPKDSVTISELLTLLGIPAAQHTSGNARQVAGILRMFGWSRGHTRTGKAWTRQ